MTPTLVPWFVHLVGEVDEELRVTLDGEALHPQGCGGLEASDQPLVLCDAVGDLLTPLEEELHGVGSQVPERPSRFEHWGAREDLPLPIHVLASLRAQGLTR